jgi:hypothetical protein
MEIIALAYKTKAKSDSDNSILYAFIAPSWAGNHIVEAELSIRRDDLLNYSLMVSDSYEEARKKAYCSQMSEDDYYLLYSE